MLGNEGVINRVSSGHAANDAPTVFLSRTIKFLMYKVVKMQKVKALLYGIDTTELTRDGMWSILTRKEQILEKVK